MNLNKALQTWNKEKRQLIEFWVDRSGQQHSDGYKDALKRMASRYMTRYLHTFSVENDFGTPAYILMKSNKKLTKRL